MDALKATNAEYRAWRMHNGVLVETTVKEAIPDIENDIKNVASDSFLLRANGLWRKRRKNNSKIVEWSYDWGR